MSSISRGFTLLEVLTVVAVMSIMTSVSYLVIPPLLDQARDTRRKVDLHRIKTSLEIYYDSVKQYPEELPACGQPLEYGTQKFLPSMPCDPITKESYYYQIKKNNLDSFRLYALLSNAENFSISDVGCGGGCGPDCFYNYGVSSTNVGLLRCSYVCAPGGGKDGTCELYQDTGKSSCPKLYGKDSSCEAGCGDSENRCQNASGKHIPN